MPDLKWTSPDGRIVIADSWLIMTWGKQCRAKAKASRDYARELYRLVPAGQRPHASERRRIAHWFQRSIDEAKLAAGYESIVRAFEPGSTN